jgi:hypothetical protein
LPANHFIYLFILNKPSDKKPLSLSKWLIVPVAALITLGLTELLAAKPHITETFYTNGIYPFIVKVLSFLSNLVPFSISDLFYALLILLIPVLTIFVIFRKISFLKWLMVLINIITIVYLLFYWLWGFNYFREDFNQRLNIPKSKTEPAQFLTVFASLIDETNSYANGTDYRMELHQIDSLIEKSYNKQAGFLGVDGLAGHRMPKFITLSDFFAKAGISGYYGPFFNELHINRKAHPLELPVILAHEKSHQYGITSEAEASFYAWFVCSESDSDYLKYSANLYILRYFLNYGFQLPGFNETVAELSGQARRDLIAIRDHWLSMRNDKIDKVATKANDAYLKSNKVEAGIADYSGVVALVMDYKTYRHSVR